MQLRSDFNIGAVSPTQWNSLSGSEFPFSEHAFLTALEESSCVGEESGWQPCHLTLWDSQKLQGGLCLYEKNNSYGEYIFDWGWAKAYERHGLNYYPKLVSAIPFTPATGAKLLVHPDTDKENVRKKLLEGALVSMRDRQCTSLHFLFITAEELPAFTAMGFLIRHSFQFHWKNNNYRDFADFLTTLKGKRRKEILRERRQIEQQRINVEVLEGEAILPVHIQQMFLFYRSTTDKKWGQSYLSADFFQRLYATMRKRMVLILAYAEGECVAGTINFKKGDCLYGRYWGCNRNYRSLHFELCYYQPLEYAIRHGINLFEAGAQGEHKIQRGFLPELTYSSHWLEHPGFRNSVAKFLEDEKQAISRGIEEFSPHSPYRETVLLPVEDERS